MFVPHFFNLFKYFFFIVLLFIVSGCATTPSDTTVSKKDTFESVNRVSFNINETLDQYLIKPVAETYVDFTPAPIRKGASNFFSNLSYLNVILNSLLQGKFTQAVNDALRFTFNSTLGIGGIFDVATTDLRLDKNEEDFGQTLATWGVGSGSYLYLPFLGPNTVRNISDKVPSTLLNPFFYVTSTILFPVTALNLVNTRADLLSASNIRDEAAIDSYTFTKDAFLQRREYLIFDGSPPISGYDDIFFETEEELNNILIIE